MKILNPPSYEVTFDDVLLLPNYTGIHTDGEDKNTDITSHVSKNLSFKLPIISSPMQGVTEVDMAIEMAKHGGLGVIHFFMNYEEQLSQVKQVKSKNLMVGASVAVLSQEGFNHCIKLADAGCDLVSLESLQANNIDVINFIKRLRKKKPGLQIMAAHACTADATVALIKAGASCIRVGIGGGSHCTTRLITGIGRPQLSAVLECSKAAQKYKVPIVSDTGIRYPGDIIKALAFGASSVMIGGLLSGTDKTPGELIKKGNEYFKFSSGNASQNRIYGAKKIGFYRYFKNEVKKVLNYHVEKSVQAKFVEEGVSNLIPFKGETDRVLTDLENSLRKSMWYLGAHNISEVQKKSRAIICSPSTMAESKPRI